MQEQNTVDYIALFEFYDEEIIHFYLDVQIPGEKYPKKIEHVSVLPWAQGLSQYFLSREADVT